jgi:hypothetical protein
MSTGIILKIFNRLERTYSDARFYRVASQRGNPKEKEEEWRATQ